MHLTEDQLKCAEEMGYRLFTPAMTAINIEVDEVEFCEAVSIPGTPERNAYYKGYIRQQTELRESIIKSAGNGSNPAQQQLLSIMNILQSSL